MSEPALRVEGVSKLYRRAAPGDAGEWERPPPELDFLDYIPFGNLTAGGTVECGEGYYVLGDDTRDSDDSRFNGPVPPEQILGRAWLILDPAERRGLVNLSL